jgi:hypothetical protein
VGRLLGFVVGIFIVLGVIGYMAQNPGKAANDAVAVGGGLLGIIGAVFGFFGSLTGAK